MTSKPDDGTTLGRAIKIVEAWKEANDVRFLSPRASRDLAERIKRAVLEERFETVIGRPVQHIW
ncbi:hypothetical protein Q2941_05595 [Bradyrhizobium sp. UFLA05-153]